MYLSTCLASRRYDFSKFEDTVHWTHPLYLYSEQKRNGMHEHLEFHHITQYAMSLSLVWRFGKPTLYAYVLYTNTQKRNEFHRTNVAVLLATALRVVAFSHFYSHINGTDGMTYRIHSFSKRKEKWCCSRDGKSCLRNIERKRLTFSLGFVYLFEKKRNNWFAHSVLILEQSKIVNNERDVKIKRLERETRFYFVVCVAN